MGFSWGEPEDEMGKHGAMWWVIMIFLSVGAWALIGILLAELGNWLFL